MSDFKLIAIRPRKGCYNHFLKVLKPDKMYQFYNDYTFEYVDGDKTKDVIGIKPTPTIPDNLYKIERQDVENPLHVNVSAIVGKNGSGKSVLSELLYLSAYNLSAELSVIKDDNDVYAPVILGVLVELYYVIGNEVRILKIDTLLLRDYVIEPDKPKNRSCTLTVGNLNLVLPLDRRDLVDNELLKAHFFYTIAINYSLYGLNSLHLGNWINSLFHKNDGYQTPIVLNPFRDKGNIDINTENDLVYQRLLSNILEPVDKNDMLNSLRNLANDKVATNLVLKAREGYVLSKKERKAYDKKEYNIEIINEDEYVSTLFEKYTKKPLAKFEDDFFKEIVENYAQVKLRKICNRYDRYREFLPKYARSEGDLEPSHYVKLDKLVTTFLEDNSHVTFKLKQAFNFLAYIGLWHEWVDLQFGAVFLNTSETGAKFYYGEVPKTSIQFDIEEIADRIAKAKALAEEKDILLTTIELLPLPFFEIGIGLDDGTNFEDLSSGEKQRCYSLSSIAYHITNLNSVFKNGKSHELKLLEYAYLNIFFDEVELYFHPEFQRTYLSDLLTYIKRINYINTENIKGVNICFLTHSPFILSDIPNQNLLRLDDGKPDPYVESEKTFGANIHDLLANDFFMPEGYIGHFAKNEIDNLVTRLHNEEQLSDIERLEMQKTIAIIGEDLIRDRLQEIFDEKFRSDDELREELVRISKILANRDATNKN